MCQPQRCVVIGPSVLAMPCSSPGFHGGAGLRLAAAINAGGSAASAPWPKPRNEAAAGAPALGPGERNFGGFMAPLPAAWPAATHGAAAWPAAIQRAAALIAA